MNPDSTSKQWDAYPYIKSFTKIKQYMKSGLKKIISNQFPIGAAESMLRMPQVPNCTCIKVPHFLTPEGQARLHRAANLMATFDKRELIRNKGSLSSTKPIR